MKREIIYAALLLFVTGAASAQLKQEAQVLALSDTIFRWEINNQVDSLMYLGFLSNPAESLASLNLR